MCGHIDIPLIVERLQYVRPGYWTEPEGNCSAVLEKIDSEKEPDINAINQELQAIGDLANGVSSPKYDSVKTSVNSTIGTIRTYMGSKQDNDYNRMIEAYNRYISNMNTTNMNELDQ